MENKTDPVVVVGAGPTGLTAALELDHHGVPCTVLDAGSQRCDGSRAIAIHRTTLAVWEKLGCAEPMLREGVAWQVRRTFLGEHELYSQVMPPPAPDVLPTFLNLPQYRTEDLLIRRIASVPSIDLRWQHRVVRVQQDGSGVTVEVETPTGPVRLRAGYVLACDGAGSPMRKLLGLDFPGKTYNDRFLIADIRADLPMSPEPQFFFDHHTNPGSTILIHPQPGRAWRFDWQLRGVADTADERTPEALERRLRALIGDTPYELIWLSDYRFHQRRLNRLRHGRMFFLGDAAHLMAPFGARGMNSSIHDVENLGWKLARVWCADAPEKLLDTYEMERGAAHRNDQLITNATMRFMAPRTTAQRIRRAVVLKLSTRLKVAHRWVDSGKMSEPFTYRTSPILIPDDAPRRMWRGAPVVGSKAPDGACVLFGGPHGSGTGPLRLRRLLGRRFVVLYFAKDYTEACSLVDDTAITDQADWFTLWPIVRDVSLSMAHTPVLHDHIGELTRVFAARPDTLFLLRPDGYVAARRRTIRLSELTRLVRLASGNAPGRARVAQEGSGCH